MGMCVLCVCTQSAQAFIFNRINSIQLRWNDEPISQVERDEKQYQIDRFLKNIPTHTHTHIAQCFEQIKFEKQNKEFVMTNKGDDAMMG